MTPARSAPPPARRSAPRPRPEPGADEVLQQFRIVFNAVKAHFQQVERRVGVGGAQVWALSVVRERPGLGIGELAQALNVKQPTASIIVRNLVQLGHVESRREGPDKRSVQLHITAEGRAVLRRAPGPHTGVLPQALASLPAGTLAKLEEGLAELIEALGVGREAANTPLAKSTAAKR